MYFNDESNSTNIDDEFNDHSKNKFNLNLSKNQLIIGGAIVVVLLIIGIYMIIPKEPPTEYYLVLSGLEDMVIYQNTEFVDPGYEAYDNKGNNFYQDVVVEGVVNSSVVGEYIITYSYNEVAKERIVTVVAKNNTLTFLTLLGDRTMFLKKGTAYVEPGYNAVDSRDDRLKDKVEVTGKVDENTPGTYKIIYSVVNSQGIEFVEERTVIVLGTDVSISYTTEDYTKDNVVINVGVVDNYFDYMILPNNTKSYERYITYSVTENGVYKFLVYSKDGTYQEKTLEIKNIDKVSPTGSCSGYYKSGKSYITINANDNMTGISKYVVDNQTFKKNTITLNSEKSSVSVMVYDGVLNGTSISCKLTNNNPVVKPSASSSSSSSKSSASKSSSSTGSTSGNVVMCSDDKIYYGTKYSLTQSQKEKLAAMVYAEGGYNYVGMKAVASHMCNLHEVNKFNYPSSTSTLYEYIHNNGWYAKRTREMKYDGSKSYMRQALSAVEEVIVQGKRTLPLYIDEFDWFPNDVVNAKDKSQYVQGQTIYYNKYGDENDLITFWCFNLNSNGTSGNIFGYLKRNEKYKKYIESR